MRTSRSGRPVVSGAVRAALRVCAIALVSSATGCGLRSSFDVEPGAAYSTNPAYERADAEDPAAGAALRSSGFLAVDDSPVAIWGLEAAGYGGDGDADYVEADVVVNSLVTYDAGRRVRPHGIDLAGLHPRWERTFKAGIDYYTYTIEKVSFEEDDFGRLDSEIQTHAVAFALPFSEDSPIALLGEYSWSTCEWADLNDFEAEGGALVFLWKPAGEDEEERRVDWGKFRGAAREQPMLALAMEMPILVVRAGWRKLEDFTGPVADPDDEISSFAGRAALSQRWGATTVAVSAAYGPERSYVSNYQVRTSAAAGLSTRFGEGWRLEATLAYAEADRSMGSDLTLWSAAAGAERAFGGDWRAALGVRWRQRSSEAPDECYDVLSVFAGVAWRGAFFF